MSENRETPTTATGLQRRLTAALDLDSLPDLLTDEQRTAVEAIAFSALPPLPPCDEAHFIQALRMMLAVLPRQNSDDLSGELFVEAYRRQLAEYPRDAITYLVDQSCRICRWFPTIAECLEIIDGWRRSDVEVLRRENARRVLARDRAARMPPPQPTAQAERWTPEPGELERIKAEIAAKFPTSRT